MKEITNRLSARIMACSGLFYAVGMEVDAQAAISMGVADGFAVLGGTTVTNTGNSVIYGELGVSPGTAVTGFPPGTIIGGTIHMNDGLSIQAGIDAGTAYAELLGRAVSATLTGEDLGGMLLTPGVYWFESSAELTGILTLDGQNQIDPLWIFQIGTTLTTASNASIIGINGADPRNIFFGVGSSATLGTDTRFEGTIIADQSITLTTGASVNGRLLALGGAVTLDTNQVMVVPEPSMVGLALMALGAGVLRRRR